MSNLIGRDGELLLVDDLLDRASTALAALRVVGDPGIGKSSLLDVAAARAAERGFRVLASRPVASEARLAFASLADLVEPIVDRSLANLPGPQRDAIEVALLRRSGEGLRAAPRAVAAAATAILREAAGERPILLLVDDAQWLDGSSAVALTFAIRRLREAPVAVLIAHRRGEREEPPLADLDSLGREQIDVLELGELSLSAVYHLLRDRGIAPASRPPLRRIHEAAAGNPMFAIELARVLATRVESVGPQAPLPVPQSILALLTRRVGAHGTDARLAMLVVALAGAPTEAVVRAVEPAAAERIDELVAAGILERIAGRLRFTHPLLGEVAGASFAAEERRDMHRRLAQAESEPEVRVRHRALGAEAPDGEVAAELDAVAAAAGRMSAEVACDLLELAIAATPGDDTPRRHARMVELGRARIRAGDMPGAVRVLEAVTAEADPGPLRARALELLAQTDWVTGHLDLAVHRCDEGLGHPDLDPWIRARLAVTRARLALDPVEASRRATAALEAVDALSVTDPALRVEALTALVGARAALGEGIDPTLVAQALEAEAIAPPMAVSDRFSSALGAWLKYQGDFDGARRWLRRTRDAAVAEGDEGSLPFALSHLPQLELWTGDWEAAAAAAAEHLTVAEWTGQEEQRLTAIYSLALVDAHAGRLDVARDRITSALPDAERLDQWNVYQLLSVLGFVELSAGRPLDALVPLRRAEAIYESYGVGEIAAVHENLAEALVDAGELDRAEQLLASYLERAERLRRPMALAAIHRALGLAHAAHGRLPEAIGAIEIALGHEDQSGVPFSRARTLLAAGRVRRRSGDRRAARAAIAEALDIFGRLGALAWVARSRAEADRVPGRRPTPSDDLTPTERRVAELVAIGRTNREVAAELFVAQKTIEANLTRIYAKLGVRSRAELAATLAHRPADRAEL